MPNLFKDAHFVVVCFSSSSPSPSSILIGDIGTGMTVVAFGSLLLFLIVVFATRFSFCSLFFFFF